LTGYLLTLFVIVILMMLIVAVGVPPATAVAGSVIVFTAAIAQDGLPVLAVPVLDVPRAVDIVAQPGAGLVDDYFISAIEIVAVTPGRQGSCKDPTAAIKVNELMLGNIVVGLDRGQVVIIDPVIA